MKRTRSSIYLLFFLLVSLQVSARMRENDHLPVVIDYSDGRSVAGKLRIMGSRPLVVTPEGGNQHRIEGADILCIEQLVKSATLEQPWTFKEAGKPGKIYFDGHYPLLNLMTRVTLTNGEVITGHVISAVYVFVSENGKEKIFLKRQFKGKVGQGLEDIVYVKRICYTENNPLTGQVLAGTVTGCGRLISVKAIDLEREQIHKAKISGEGFDFGRVLPGKYDLCILTDQMAVVGLSDETPSSLPKGLPLTDHDRQELKKVFPQTDDFFNDRWVVLITGRRNYARMLVYKRRADFHDAKNMTPGGWVWHLDVWNWHNPRPFEKEGKHTACTCKPSQNLSTGDMADSHAAASPEKHTACEWKIDSRHIFARHLQKKDDVVRPLYLAEELGPVTPGKKLTIHYETNRKQWRLLRSLD